MSPANGRQHRALVAEAETGLLDLIVVAAQKGFWEFSKYFMEELAGQVGLEDNQGCDTFALRERIVKCILDTDDEEIVLSCLHERMKSLRQSYAAPREFLEFEETEELMDKADSTEYKQSQKKHEEAKEELAAFRGEYMKNRWNSKRKRKLA